MVRLMQSRRAARLMAALVLVAAVLPNVLYVGHWSAPGPEAAHSHSTATPEESDEHELHCHKGPSRCAGPQSLTGSLWVGEEAGLLALDAQPRQVDLIETTRRIEAPTARILQPPKTV